MAGAIVSTDELFGTGGAEKKVLTTEELMGAGAAPPKKSGGWLDILKSAVAASSAESDLAVAGAGPAAALTTGAMAFPLSGIAGGAKWLASGDVTQAYDTMTQVNEALTPKLNESEARAVEALMTPLEMLNRAASAGGKKAAEVTGVPVMDPIVGTILEAGGLLAGPAALKAGKRAVIKPLSEIRAMGTGLEPVAEIQTARAVLPPDAALGELIPYDSPYVNQLLAAVSRENRLALPEGQGFEIVPPKAPEPLPSGAVPGASGQVPLEWLRGAIESGQRPFVPEPKIIPFPVEKGLPALPPGQGFEMVNGRLAPKSELRLPPREALERSVQPEPDLVNAADRASSEAMLRKAIESDRTKAAEASLADQLQEAVGGLASEDVLKAKMEVPKVEKPAAVEPEITKETLDSRRKELMERIGPLEEQKKVEIEKVKKAKKKFMSTAAEKQITEINNQIDTIYKSDFPDLAEDARKALLKQNIKKEVPAKTATKDPADPKTPIKGTYKWDVVKTLIDEAPEIQKKFPVEKRGSKWIVTAEENKPISYQDRTKGGPSTYMGTVEHKFDTKEKAIDFSQGKASLHGAYPEGTGKVIIDVAGTKYKIWNTKEALNAFRDSMRKEFNKTEFKNILGTERGSFSLRFKDDVRDRIKQALPKGSEAEKVDSMYDRTVEKRTEREAVTYRKIKDTLVRSMLDVSGNLKREALKADPVIGRQVVMNRELLSGASGKAATLMDEGRKAVFDDLRADEVEVLNRVIQSRRIIDIDAYKEGMKHPEGLTGKEHAEYLKALEKADPELSRKLNDKAKKYFDIQRDQIKQLLDDGIVTKEAADALMSHEYSPRRFFQYLDPESSYDFGGRKITVPDSGIKALDEGSLNLLENNAEALMAQVISRTQARIFRNRANKALWEMADKVKDNGIVRPAKIVGSTKQGAPVYEDTPGGFEKVKVMIDGKVKEMIMPWEMAQEWVKTDPLINQTLANVIGTISGAKVLRPVATGYNPGFALTNIPRDVALIWTATKEYSAHLPVAAGQMVRDFAAVAPDVMKRKGRVRDYIDEGGAMNFLTYYGRMSGKGHLGESLSQLGRIMGWVGETSEIWSRMALRERALRNGKTPQEATWEARRYLDFNQGGNIAKGLDSAIPYLNAAIQGTRGLLRGAKQSPGRFTWQMAQLGTVSTGLYLANFLTNPECWQQVTDRDKEANFIITTPMYFTDDKGQKKYLYFKVAKDQGQRVVTSFFDALMTRSFEGKYPTKQMMQAIGDLTSVAGIPPTLAAAAAYLMNKDTWTNEDVWRGPKVDPSEEYRKDTHPFWVGAGQATGMSPTRLGAAAGKIIPPNNPFVGMVGGAYKMVTGKLPEDLKDKSMTQIMTEIPTVRRVMSTTNPYTPHQESIDKIRQDEATKSFVQNRDFDVLTDKYLRSNDPADAEKVIQFVEKAPPEDQDHLEKRFFKQQKLFKIPDRSWWLNASDTRIPPEGRAAIFWERYSKASAPEKEKMLEIADQIGGFTSERFINRIAELASGHTSSPDSEVNGE